MLFFIINVSVTVFFDIFQVSCILEMYLVPKEHVLLVLYMSLPIPTQISFPLFCQSSNNYMYVFIQSLYHGENVTQDQFLSGVKLV